MKKNLSFVLFSLFFITFIFMSNTDIISGNQMELEKSYKGTPILDNTVLPGFVLSEDCTCNLLKVLHLMNPDGRWETGGVLLEKNFNNTDTVKRERETWNSLSYEEFLKKEKILGKGKVPIWSFYIVRYTLGSKKDASLFANAYIKQQGEEFSEGSYSGELLGDICWTNKNSYRAEEEKKAFGFIANNKLIFVKGTVVVSILGGSGPEVNNPNPMPPEFVEKIARAIDNKLK